MRKYLTLNFKKPLSDPYHGQLVEPKSLNKNEQPPLAKPTRQGRERDKLSNLIATRIILLRNESLEPLLSTFPIPTSKSAMHQ